MPHKIILDDIFDEMLDDISCIKLNSYIYFEKDQVLSFNFVKLCYLE